MRLLEFTSDQGGANPRQATIAQTFKEPATRSEPQSAPAAPPRQSAGMVVFPLNGNFARKPAQRRPIDIEQLQQRIERLESRILERSQRTGETGASKELEKLKERMKLLERSVNMELWAARQREHELLEMLSRPAARDRVQHFITRFVSQTVPAMRDWMDSAGREWWSDNQPMWWPEFVKTWYEALDRARGIHRD